VSLEELERFAMNPHVLPSLIAFKISLRRCVELSQKMELQHKDAFYTTSWHWKHTSPKYIVLPFDP
jgi:hypothetical protein